jgi:hypothetical protein
MKHRIFSIATFFLVFMTSISVQAQVIGIRLGGHIANTKTTGLISSLTPEMNNYSGWTAGVFTELPLNQVIAFRPEVNFTQKGFITPIETDIKLFDLDIPIGVTTKTRFNYVEAPLLLQYSPSQGTNGWYVFAGPSVGYLMHGEIRPVANAIIDINLPKFDIPLSSTTDRFEVAGVAGLGIQAKVGQGKIFAEGRYQHGLTNVLKNPIVDVKVMNTGFSFAAGYAQSF